MGTLVSCQPGRYDTGLSSGSPAQGPVCAQWSHVVAIAIGFCAPAVSSSSLHVAKASMGRSASPQPRLESVFLAAKNTAQAVPARQAVHFVFRRKSVVRSPPGISGPTVPTLPSFCNGVKTPTEGECGPTQPGEAEHHA